MKNKTIKMDKVTQTLLDTALENLKSTVEYAKLAQKKAKEVLACATNEIAQEKAKEAVTCAANTIYVAQIALDGFTVALKTEEQAA